MSQSPLPTTSEPEHTSTARPDLDHQSSHDDDQNENTENPDSADNPDMAAAHGNPDDEEALAYGYDFEIKEQDRWLPIANGQ